MKNKIIFKINKFEFIKFIFQGKEADLEVYDSIDVIFCDKGGKECKLASKDSIIHSVINLKERLEAALRGDLDYDKSLKLDIGLEWNNYLKNMFKLTKKRTPYIVPNWIGQKYLLWISDGLETWIYEKDNKFFLEATPTYKWHFDYPKKFKNVKGFISYEKFLENYKAYFVREIAKDYIISLLEKCQKLSEFLIAKENAKRE